MVLDGNRGVGADDDVEWTRGQIVRVTATERKTKDLFAPLPEPRNAVVCISLRARGTTSTTVKRKRDQRRLTVRDEFDIASRYIIVT